MGIRLLFRNLMQLDVGVLESYTKCRGMKKARREMLEAIKADMETRYSEYNTKDEIYLLAASSADEETTKGWIEEIEAFFPGKKVLCDNLSLGICCHTGEGALGVGCSCRPRRK